MSYTGRGRVYRGRGRGEFRGRGRGGRGERGGRGGRGYLPVDGFREGSETKEIEEFIGYSPLTEKDWPVVGAEVDNSQAPEAVREWDKEYPHDTSEVFIPYRSPSPKSPSAPLPSSVSLLSSSTPSSTPLLTSKEPKKEAVPIATLQELLTKNTHLTDMEKFVNEAIVELHKQQALTDEDVGRLLYLTPTTDADQSSKRVGSFSYPSIPLYKILAGIIEEWMWSGTCYAQDLPTYQHLDEGDGIERRKMVFDTLSCHMMSLRTSWEGLEEDMKRYKIVQLFKDVGKRGMLDLLGVRRTVGTQNVFPVTRDILEASFRQDNKSGSQLTVGARALAKHCHRDETNNWWGNLTGSEKAKNENAEKVLKKILKDVGWLNIHQLPHALPILEVRNMEGYGARWSPDGEEFRGFLEPPMVAGWETGYRH